jgi:hypothetical protein
MMDIQFPFAQDKRFYERLLTDLEVIADSNDDLAARLRRARLRFEFVGLDAHKQEALAAEWTGRIDPEAIERKTLSRYLVSLVARFRSGEVPLNDTGAVRYRDPRSDFTYVIARDGYILTVYRRGY